MFEEIGMKKVLAVIGLAVLFDIIIVFVVGETSKPAIPDWKPQNMGTAAADYAEKSDAPKVADKEEERDMSDIDLTAMSPTMVFSTAVNITGRPSKYEGRVLRMAGTYAEYTDERGVLHHNCVVKDAPGCCEHGIEFELVDGNYPNIGAEIVVEGILGKYDHPDPQLPDWVNKADSRYDGVLNVTIVRGAALK